MTENIAIRLEQHLEEINLKADWFVIALQGSQNYNLDDELSDVDSKLLVCPSFGELVKATSPLSFTHIMSDNEEHVDVKDVRAYFKLFKKQNPSFTEILFSKHVLVNTLYEEEWSKLIQHREEIVRLNPIRTMRSMRGMAGEKLHAMCHRYPSRASWIDTYGYDPKQLSHILRLRDLMEGYLKGKPYESCLCYERESERARILRLVKRGFLDKAIALALGEKIMEKMDKMVEESLNVFPCEENQETLALLDEILTSIVKKSIIVELEKDFDSK